MLVENLFKYIENESNYLGKGLKIKLIIFTEFSAIGVGAPPIRENDYFFLTGKKFIWMLWNM